MYCLKKNEIFKNIGVGAGKTMVGVAGFYQNWLSFPSLQGW